MNISLNDDQYKQISSKDNIRKTLELNKAIGFNIMMGNEIIDFAMLRKYDEGCYFLWDYAIDFKCQNRRYGTRVLIELIEYVKNNYSIREMSTAYIFGNNIEAHVYERLGLLLRIL